MYITGLQEAFPSGEQATHSSNEVGLKYKHTYTVVVRIIGTLGKYDQRL